MIKATVLALLVASGASDKADKVPAKPKLAVLELTAAGGVDAKVAGALTETITQEVANAGFFSVLSSREVQTLVGFERQKQMMGCSEESSCLAELAGAMGARFVMSGTLAKLGEAYQLSLQVLDSSRAQPVGRTVRIARELTALQAQIPFAVAEATATPPPAPPSRVLPYSLMAGGGLLVVGGAVVGLDGLSRDAALARELSPENTVLKPLSVYRREAEQIGFEKTVSLVAITAGAALVGAGLLLNPPEVVSRSGAAVTLVPGPNGFALVGVFP